jgi:preprotein translocase subunit SecD
MDSKQPQNVTPESAPFNPFQSTAPIINFNHCTINLSIDMSFDHHNNHNNNFGQQGRPRIYNDYRRQQVPCIQCEDHYKSLVEIANQTSERLKKELIEAEQKLEKAMNQLTTLNEMTKQRLNEERAKNKHHQLLFNSMSIGKVDILSGDNGTESEDENDNNSNNPDKK